MARPLCECNTKDPREEEEEENEGEPSIRPKLSLTGFIWRQPRENRRTVDERGPCLSRRATGHATRPPRAYHVDNKTSPTNSLCQNPKKTKISKECFSVFPLAQDYYWE